MKNIFLKLSLLFMVICTFENVSAQMFWNQAGSFSGNTNSYLRVRPTSFTNITGSFTLEAWVCPTVNSANLIIMSKGTGAYALKLTSRRPDIVTNNISRLLSKQSSALPLNKWSHVAGTYNSANNKFELYINGLLDTSAIVAAPPPADTDSLYIGKEQFSTYTGKMDEIRVWKRALSSSEIKANFRTFLNVLNPINTTYNALSLSISFQNSFSGVDAYTTLDWTNNNNPVFSSNVTKVDQTNQMNTTIATNESLLFDGTGDYAAVPTTPNIEINGAFTMEAWVFLKAYNPAANQKIINKSPGIASGYRMYISTSNQIVAGCNGNVLGSGSTIPLNIWTHIAFTQDAGGVSRLYVNGLPKITSTIPVVSTNSDSLYIGGLPTGEGFNGFIDEVRISKFEKTQKQIKDYMYTSIDRANEFPGTDVVYNFDGGISTSANIGTNAYLRGNTKFSNPSTTLNTPISPLHRFDQGNFPLGYRMKTANKRIPESGTSGTIYDTIYVNSTTTISDVNIFVGINHAFDEDVHITLFAPNGDSANICIQKFLLDPEYGDIIGIFDDQADSSLVSGMYTSFSPRIKAEQNMNGIFNGDNPQGKWILRVKDNAVADIGMLYSWGIQLNGETLVGVEDPHNISIPDRFALEQNYPNPFNPSTAIKFNIPSGQFVKLKIYDIAGREVASLVNKELAAGSYEYLFDGSKLSSGVYFYKIEAGEFIETKKMILVK